MPSPTSGRNEKLVQCDVSDLHGLPSFPGGEMIAIKGHSPSQVGFAANMRIKKMKEWSPDLPADVMEALKGVNDATWWLANKDNDSSSIHWPHSWTVPKTSAQSLRESDGTFQCPKCGISREKQDYCQNPDCADYKKPLDLTRSRTLVANADQQAPLVQFEAFARKACLSPELSYLAMMALMYRQTKDNFILTKFGEARQKVQSHLDAIDEIIGRPGD